MKIFKTFQGLENFYIKFQDFPYFSRICTNPLVYLYELLILVCIWLCTTLLRRERTLENVAIIFSHHLTIITAQTLLIWWMGKSCLMQKLAVIKSTNTNGCEHDTIHSGSRWPT